VDASRRRTTSRITRKKDGSNLDREEIETDRQSDQFAKEPAKAEGKMTGWQQPIRRPVVLPDGRQLATLKNAAASGNKELPNSFN